MIRDIDQKGLQIQSQFDCTQRELVIDIARIIYRTHGGEMPPDPTYLWRSQHSTEKGCLAAAEIIFEMFWGDSPTYQDEDED